MRKLFDNPIWVMIIALWGVIGNLMFDVTKNRCRIIELEIDNASAWVQIRRFDDDNIVLADALNDLKKLKPRQVRAFIRYYEQTKDPLGNNSVLYGE